MNRSHRIGWLVLVLTAALIVGIAGYAMGRARPSTDPTPATSTRATSPSPVASTTPSQSPSTGGDPADQTPPPNITVAGDVGVPGLWRGTATVTSGNTGTINGLPVGWAQTVDGAVGAALTYQAANLALPNLIDKTGDQINNRIYSADGLQTVAPDAARRAGTRSRVGIDSAGRPLGVSGSPAPGLRYFGGGVPRYGAYKVTAVTRRAAGAPVEVSLSTMIPMYAGTGTGSDLSNVKLYFRHLDVVLKWLKGPDGTTGWRISDITTAENLSPATSARSNVGYAELRSLLGPGWAVPADGTQDKLPGVVFSR